MCITYLEFLTCILFRYMRFNSIKRWRKKFELRVRVWKIMEEKTWEEYHSMVRDKVEKAEWKYSV